MAARSPRPTSPPTASTSTALRAAPIADAVSWLFGQLDLEHGYVALQVYLDRFDHADFAGAREIVAQRTGRPTTFGWGPRFLHSTGQYHKGGPATGVFLQITGDPVEDLDVPGRDFTFGSFIESQAAGDAAVLRERGRPSYDSTSRTCPPGSQLAAHRARGQGRRVTTNPLRDPRDRRLPRIAGPVQPDPVRRHG